MQLKLISCNVFQREVCLCLSRTPQLVDPEFVELGAHANPAKLRTKLQEHIDRADASGIAYDAILLLYGVCGNAGVGLHARRAPLVIPRAHDCATLLLGSKARFLEEFGDNPSRPFSSVGYFERGMETYRAEGGVWGDGENTYESFVEKYGEDNARYLWKTLHPMGEDSSAVFIDVPEISREGIEDRVRERLAAEGRTLRVAQGDLGLIRRLIDADWSENDFLIVPPGNTTVGVYDMDTILAARPSPLAREDV